MTINRRTFLGKTGLAMAGISLLVTRGTQAQPLLGMPDGVDQVRLTLKPEQRIWSDQLPGPVELWGFVESELRLQQGRPAAIEVVNELPEPTSIHWHGIRVPNAMDGVSGLTQEPIPPGGTFLYEFTPPDAGTYWAHSHHKTYEQLARGVYLPLIVEEATPYEVDRDLTLTLDDWRLNEAGQIDTESFGNLHDWSHAGRMGNIFTVGRAPFQTFELNRGETHRIRLINAANARIFQLEFPDIPIWVIAKDGQPLANPKLLENRLIIGPAERYDLWLETTAEIPERFALTQLGRNEDIELAEFVLVGQLSSDAPQGLRPLPPTSLSNGNRVTADQSHEIRMSGGAMGSMATARYQGEELSIQELIEKGKVWAFNGEAGMTEEPLLVAKTGELIEITLINESRWPHSMHVHGHHFQSDSERYPEGTWHDTIVMAGQEQVTIRFIADQPGDWVIHCHMVEHQAAGMATRFKVVAA